jgi:N-methylhydantoinase A/oxoprolinase/acetone carboxylase beta subunit
MVGTDALIERRGTKLGLIATEDFEYTVKVGHARNWGEGVKRPDPLIPQSLIVDVQERIDNLGNVIIRWTSSRCSKRFNI